MDAQRPPLTLEEKKQLFLVELARCQRVLEVRTSRGWAYFVDTSPQQIDEWFNEIEAANQKMLAETEAQLPLLTRKEIEGWRNPNFRVTQVRALKLCDEIERLRGLIP